MKRPPPDEFVAAAAIVSGPRPLAYVTPFTMTTNAYMEMQKALLGECGFEPRPLSIRHLLLEGGWRGLLDRRNVVMAQWIEMRAFRWRDSYPRLSPSGMLVFLFYLLTLKLARARVIYVVHDHAVHDTAGFGRKVSRWLIAWCRRTADLRVVHDAQAAALYGATYLPHPLFWDSPGAPACPPREPAPLAPLRCAMLGAIRPYKAIDTVLEAWPPGRSLTIAGRAKPDLLDRLLQIVGQRGLESDVVIDPTHQSDQAFSERIEWCDVLILPHASESALVSGAFFEAIGRVPWLIARRSSFIDWAAQHFPQVLPFDSPAELPSLLAQIDIVRQRTPVDLAQVRQSALRHFGWSHCRDTWAAFLSADARVPSSDF
jgi:glycosyltransferase involved in cell wall biosynthesis